MTIFKRFMILAGCVLFCLALTACESEKRESVPVPSQGGKPILSVPQTEPSPNDYTAVYVTVFDDLAILATYPVLENPNAGVDPEDVEPDCGPRELSNGGSILCGGQHETDRPITRVLIVDELVPKSMAGWFRDMIHLQQIDGLNKIRTHHVTDMNHLFAGCGRLAEISADTWDVSNVEDMTGIFEGCTALSSVPSWYEQGNDESLG